METPALNKIIIITTMFVISKQRLGQKPWGNSLLTLVQNITKSSQLLLEASKKINSKSRQYF